uniref:Uncharacterized protein n=1 Tax=Arcella intermedia TaxID=1963864 RepID=A0A6B2LHU1_9EUKA
MKIVLLGDSGVGKSSLLVKYVKEVFSGDYKATIGADFLAKDVSVDGEVASLQIWDTAGQERFVSLCVAFFRGSDACVLVYDVNEEKSIKSLANWREKFLEFGGKPEDRLPFFVFGNKADNDVPLPEQNIKLAKDWAASHDIPHFLTSAKTGTGLDDAFNEITRKILSLADDPVEQESGEIVDISQASISNISQEKSSKPSGSTTKESTPKNTSCCN